MATSVDELAPHILPDVQGLEEGNKKAEELDSGAYGIVFKVSVGGLPCMAKKLHDVFKKDLSANEKGFMQRKFREECILLSKLNHPNIVHFVGVCYGKSKQDLILVMERLRTDVATFVKDHPNVSISIKVSTLLDVSYGLVYLHGQTPPIVHRDLTAPNVLLTDDCRGKIADLGVSKVLRNPRMIKHTTAPGNAYYMAPETKVENPHYGTSIDIFSLGHLAIHISIQDWPETFRVRDHRLVESGKMEIAERKKVLEERMGKDHPLYPLAIHCLQDDPKQRPSTAKLNKTLVELSTKYPKTVDDIVSPGMSQHPRLEADIATLREDKKVLEQALKNTREQLGTELQDVKEAYSKVRTINSSLKVQLCQKKEAMEDLSSKFVELTKEKDGYEKAISELKDHLEIARTEAGLYKEDFEYERKDRMKAHDLKEEMRWACDEKVHAITRKLEDLRLTSDETIQRLTKQLENTAEDRYQVKGGQKKRAAKSSTKQHKFHQELQDNREEMRNLRDQLLEAQKCAADAQQEVQAKTAQVKQYKKKDDQREEKLTNLEQRNQELIQEMERVRQELVKTKKECEGIIEEERKIKNEQMEKIHHELEKAKKKLNHISRAKKMPREEMHKEFVKLQEENEFLREDNIKSRKKITEQFTRLRKTHCTCNQRRSSTDENMATPCDQLKPRILDEDVPCQTGHPPAMYQQPPIDQHRAADLPPNAQPQAIDSDGQRFPNSNPLPQIGLCQMFPSPPNYQQLQGSTNSSQPRDEHWNQQQHPEDDYGRQPQYQYDDGDQLDHQPPNDPQYVNIGQVSYRLPNDPLFVNASQVNYQQPIEGYGYNYQQQQSQWPQVDQYGNPINVNPPQPRPRNFVPVQFQDGGQTYQRQSSNNSMGTPSGSNTPSTPVNPAYENYTPRGVGSSDYFPQQVPRQPAARTHVPLKQDPPQTGPYDGQFESQPSLKNYGQDEPSVGHKVAKDTRMLVQPNNPQDNIDTDMKDAVTAGSSSNFEAPYDPNLVCLMCMKNYRIGEIQLFRAHVNKCHGTEL